MSEKKTIVHIIDDLGRGGAETLLVDLLKDLNDHYNIILVTLTSFSEFDEKEIRCYKRYCLNYTGKFSIPGVILRLRKIIKEHKPALVRSQLYWSTLFARIACPKNIPFVFSVHVTPSDGSFSFTRKGKILRWLEKITYNKRQVLIAVTNEVLEDYNRTIGIKGKNYVLNNYVNDKYFSYSGTYQFHPNGHLKMVAVGNPKKQKNYELIIKAFQLLNNPAITCDIYGSGGETGYDEKLQAEINRLNVPVFLKGKSGKVFEHLKNYEAFIMPSWFEGFGIAVGEAMATGLPVFLSDIKVLREVSHGNAVFFNPANEKELADKINEFVSGKYNAQLMSDKGKEICSSHYSKKGYMVKLLKIYEECIKS